jgi:photosystem II stability/assembly factor-like uncharacterized protein
LGDSGNGLNFRRDDHHPISIGLDMSVIVTNTNNSGEGSLRKAIKDVGIDGEILFDLTYPATIVVDSQLVIDRNITITGPEIGDLTISGKKNDRIIFINEDLNVNISNLSISNGHASGESADGGGIYCNSSNLFLNNVTIRGNSADSNGGGIYLYSSDVTLTNVVIAKNQATNGGGIGFWSESAILTNVTITENSALMSGGGIFCRRGDLGLRNSIVWNNSPTSFDLKFGSIEAVFSNIQGGLIGKGNIDTQPLFADTIHYYLNEDSPSIDSGDPDTLFNDEEDPGNPNFALWPAFGTLRNDMGAYGGHGKYKKISSDMNLDNFYLVADFVKEEFGWLCSDENILKTENGGQSWEILPLESIIRHIDFVNEHVGWAFGYDNEFRNSFIWKTIDGGENWSIQKEFSYNEGVEVTSLCAVNDNVVYLTERVQTDGVVWKIKKTLDGGNIWIDITPANDNNIFNSVSFLNSDVGIVSGGSKAYFDSAGHPIKNNACILRTIDGGVTWDYTYWPEYGGINTLQFVSDSAGYFVLDDRILCKTIDKYFSWNKILDGVNSLEGITSSYSALGKNIIFAITEKQKFMKSVDGGNTWEGIHLGGADFWSVKFIDHSIGWILGEGNVLKTTDGGNSWNDVTSAIIVTEINENKKASRQIPIQFKLYQNYPNPFNPVTMINYQLPMINDVELSIYNLLGQKVATLVDERQQAGYHQIEWDASGFASGIYYYRIQAGEFYNVKKMLLLR